MKIFQSFYVLLTMLLGEKLAVYLECHMECKYRTLAIINRGLYYFYIFLGLVIIVERLLITCGHYYYFCYTKLLTLIPQELVIE